MLRKRLHKHYTPSSYYNIIYYMYVLQTGGGSRIFPVGILRKCRILPFCIWFHTVNIWLSIRCIQMSSFRVDPRWDVWSKKYKYSEWGFFSTLGRLGCEYSIWNAEDVSDTVLLLQTFQGYGVFSLCRKYGSEWV